MSQHQYVQILVRFMLYPATGRSAKRALSSSRMEKASNETSEAGGDVACFAETLSILFLCSHARVFSSSKNLRALEPIF